MPSFFNTNLKYIRTLQKMSQKQLADKIGVDQSTVSYWEKGMDVTIDNVVKVSEILNVPLPELLGIDLRLEKPISKTTFKKDGMEIILGKTEEITNDDLDEAMAFILEQKMKNKESRKENNDNK